MTSYKGLCLVIKHDSLNDELFNQDIVEIKKLFSEELHYLYQMFRFTKSQELKDKIREMLNMFESCHKQILMFVFCHGDNNLFQTDDGTVTFHEIIDLYKQYSQISEIPKLFFFIEKKIKLSLASTLVKIKKVILLKPIRNIQMLIRNLRVFLQKTNRNITDSENHSPENIPEHSNVNHEINSFENKPEFQKYYLASLIVPEGGFYSLKGTPYGTLYVQTLLKAIKENPKLKIGKIGVMVGKTCNANMRMIIYVFTSGLMEVEEE